MGMCVGVYLHTMPLIFEYNSLPPDSLALLKRGINSLEFPRLPAASSLEAYKLKTAKSVGVERHT